MSFASCRLVVDFDHVEGSGWNSSLGNSSGKSFQSMPFWVLSIIQAGFPPISELLTHSATAHGQLRTNGQTTNLHRVFYTPHTACHMLLGPERRCHSVLAQLVLADCIMRKQIQHLQMSILKYQWLLCFRRSIQNHPKGGPRPSFAALPHEQRPIF